MAVDLLWVEESLYKILKESKITQEEYASLCNSLNGDKNDRQTPDN